MSTAVDDVGLNIRVDLLDQNEDPIHLCSAGFCYNADLALFAGGFVLSLDFSMPCQECCCTDFGA